MSAILVHAIRRHLSTSARRLAQSYEGPSAVSGGHEGGYKIWKQLTIFLAFPAIALCAANTVMEHNKKGHERPEFVSYEYLRIRSKRFPWGDGNKSLFHNPHGNALPNGYEEAEHGH